MKLLKITLDGGYRDNREIKKRSDDLIYELKKENTWEKYCRTETKDCRKGTKYLLNKFWIKEVFFQFNFSYILHE